MFPPNAKLNELIALLDFLFSASQAPGTYTTPNWIYVGNLGSQFQAEIEVGTMAAGGTVNALINQATSNAGANGKSVLGKAIPQVQQAAAGANTISTIDFKTQDLDTNNGFAYVQISITVGAAACTVGARLRAVSRFDSAAASNSAAVLQQV